MNKIAFTFLLLTTVAFALPGTDAPPELAKELAAQVNAGDVAKLVVLSDVYLKTMSPYTSKSKLTHLRVQFSVGNETYGGIVYAGDYTSEGQKALQSMLEQKQRMKWVGVWDTFQNQPSFEVKKFEVDSFKLIKGMVINPKVEKKQDKEQKTYLEYKFTISKVVYTGIVLAGDWDTAVLEALKKNPKQIVGYWLESDSSLGIVFVTKRVE